ncbi:MAG: hypothetical protein EBT14_08765, partial [Betaproteobacteria bacterium]|nr:hypothetical protein [Betaproteobacteria bacterium]
KAQLGLPKEATIPSTRVLDIAAIASMAGGNFVLRDDGSVEIYNPAGDQPSTSTLIRHYSPGQDLNNSQFAEDRIRALFGISGDISKASLPTEKTAEAAFAYIKEQAEQGNNYDYRVGEQSIEIINLEGDAPEVVTTITNEQTAANTDASLTSVIEQFFDDSLSGLSESLFGVISTLAGSLDLQGGVTLDLSETDVLAMAGSVSDDLRDAGLALARDVNSLLEGFSELTLPECTAGWFAFVNSFIDTIDHLAEQLSRQVDSLESRANALPDWVPTGWLAEASDLANRFNAITDDVAGFRDRWLTAEGFVASVNNIFSANDLDIHLSLLAQPTSPSTTCCDEEDLVLRPEVFLTRAGDFAGEVDAGDNPTDSWIRVSDVSR